ncbi:type II secretion system F family protein [Psychromicrobium sp. YIM B11713]|uniref:type II secretion system F family protein n=1 Tax=Psychromicrobium sp. YIM B11713 TaxID=3145233 RepID=UPI00374FCECC
MIVVICWCAIMMLFWPRNPLGAEHRRLTPKPLEARDLPEIPLTLELLASMLDAGSSLDAGLAHLAAFSEGPASRGLSAVTGALRTGGGWTAAWQIGSQLIRAGPVQNRLRQLEASLRLVALTGAPSSSLLRAEASRKRRELHRELQERAAALGVKLVLPMGLCALPAFICLGVLPVVLALFPHLD